MQQSFTPGILPPPALTEPAWWFAFYGRKLLVEIDAAQAVQIPQRQTLQELGLEPIRTQFLGYWAEQPCYSVELSRGATLPASMALKGLRSLLGLLDEEWVAIAGRAFQIMEWDRTHQYCGACATPTQQQPQERAKRCPQCGLTQYPRLSPAMIVLISKGEEILLARAHQYRTGLYSLLAGFVEPGESVEETVIREVREEVGIEIKNIRYCSSQPWPFPNSLMLGFTATYASGEITIQTEELADAAWFHRSKLPDLPPKPSIARHIIDQFVAASV